MKKLNTSFRVLPVSAIVVVFAAFQFSAIYRHDHPLEDYLKLAEDPLLQCGVKLTELKNGTWENSGTAVLIDSLHALTAAHCLVATGKRDTVVNMNGNTVKTYISTGVYPLGAENFRLMYGNQLLVVSKVLLYPDYLSDKSCDLAILTLKTPVHGLVYPALNRTYDELHDTVTGLGYGVAGPGNRPELQLYNHRIAGMNIIDSLGGKKLNGMETLLYADFDHALPGLRCNRLGDSRPLDLEYGVSGGDSGGPLFLLKDKKVILYGITARGEVRVNDLMDHGYYCSLSGWTRISVFEKWIRANLN